MDNEKVGNFIATIRKNRGLTQKELALKLSVTDKAVSKWERGLSFPDITILNSLAEVLEIDVSEILNGEYGKDKSINVQKAVDKAIENINKKQKEYIKKIKRKAITVSIIIVILGLIIFLVISNYTKYHPKEIVEGENFYKIEGYSLEENGLDIMKEIISKSQNMKDKYDISYLEASLDKNGEIKKFTLSINVFNEKEEYIGRAGFTFNNEILTYNPPKKDSLEIVHTYSKNSNLTYISNQIKRIPIKEQINLSDLNYYVISYMPGTKVDAGKPIFDCRDSIEIKAISKEDYMLGVGGKSDGDTNVVIRLYDGSSQIAEEQYLYVFDAISEKTPNNPEFMMETDYYINNGKLKFTRDYGKTWIEVDITKEQLEDTLEFYKSNSLKPNSWFIAKNDLIPIAFFYGEDTNLKISNDNGTTWRDIKLPNQEEFYRSITKRVVGFTSQNFGYAALGTDYSMGGGEMKKIYFTHDGGNTWNEVKTPVEDYSSKTLIDLYMYDEKKGIIVLDNSQDVNMPYIYATTDGGENWSQPKFSYFNLPDEIDYITDVDKITFENGEYYIQMGQGDTGTLKVIFKTRDFINSWTFVDIKNENIHTVG